MERLEESAAPSAQGHMGRTDPLKSRPHIALDVDLPLGGVVNELHVDLACLLHRTGTETTQKPAHQDTYLRRVHRDSQRGKKEKPLQDLLALGKNLANI
jgi:hypothetical protein